MHSEEYNIQGVYVFILKMVKDILDTCVQLYVFPAVSE